MHAKYNECDQTFITRFQTKHAQLIQVHSHLNEYMTGKKQYITFSFLPQDLHDFAQLKDLLVASLISNGRLVGRF